MKIQKLIQDRLKSQNFNIYNPKGEKISNEDFLAQYANLKTYLASLGHDDSIGIKLPKNSNYLMTILACMEMGIPYVPMKSDYPDSRVGQIKEESNFTILFDESTLQAALQTDAKEVKPREFTPDSKLYTICTSGSTGKPKAVVVQRKALTDFWLWVERYFQNVKENDSILQVTDFTFDISLIDVGLFLTRGTTIYFSEFSGNVFTLAYEVESYKITTLNTVVNNVSMLLEDAVAARANYSSLHTVMMGGARFSYGLYKKCEKYLKDIGVHNLYGVTEVPVYSHVKQMNFDQTDLNEYTVSVGQCLGSTTGVIVKDGKVVSQGESGELLLGGGQLMKEYANNPEKTSEALIDFEGKKYYRTGDICFQNDNGDYFITGRMDDTIKHRGFRINLLDIDSYILSRPYVIDSVTIAIPDELTQNKTVCFIKSCENKNAKEVKADLEDILLEYQIPQFIHFVDQYPTNNNGKICKKTLKQDYIDKKKFYK